MGSLSGCNNILAHVTNERVVVARIVQSGNGRGINRATGIHAEGGARANTNASSPGAWVAAVAGPGIVTLAGEGGRLANGQSGHEPSFPWSHTRETATGTGANTPRGASKHRRFGPLSSQFAVIAVDAPTASRLN